MLETLVYLIGYCFTFVFCALLVRMAGIRLTQMSLPMVLFWSAMFLAHLGYPFLFFKTVPHYVQMGATDLSIIWKMTILSSIVWIQVFLGVYFGACFFGKCSVSVQSERSDISFWVWALVSVVCVAMTQRYLQSFETIGLMKVLDEETSRLDLARLRSQMTNAFEGRYWVYSLFFETLLPFLSIIAFVEFLFFKKLRWFFGFFATFVISVFALTANLQKVPLLIYVAALIFALAFYKQKSITFTKWVSYGAVAVGIGGTLYSLFMFRQFSSVSFLAPVQRTLVGQLIPWYFYLRVFPDEKDFVWGATLPNPGNVFPWENYRYTVDLGARIEGLTATSAAGDVVGSAPTAFFGELWVNCGYFLLIGFPIAIGLAIYLLHRLFSLQPLGSVGVALLAWLSLHVSRISTKGLSFYMLDEKVFAVLGLCVLFVMVREPVRIFHAAYNRYRRELQSGGSA